MKKEDLTDEAINDFKQFLSEKDVSNYKVMTREQFEYIRHRFNTYEPDLSREMCKKLGVPFLGDLSYEEYVILAPRPDDSDFGSLSTRIDAQKAIIVGRPCILCESKKTKANLIQLEDYKLCVPLCNKCFKRDDDIKVWTEEYILMFELSRDFDTAKRMLERMLKILPELASAMGKAVGFEIDELAVGFFKKVEPDDTPLKKLSSDPSTEICLGMFPRLMELMQQQDRA